ERGGHGGDGDRAALVAGVLLHPAHNRAATGAAPGGADVGEPVGGGPDPGAAVPGGDLTVDAEGDGGLVGVLPELRQVARVGLPAVVAVGARQTDDEIDAVAGHQVAHFAPAPVALLERKDGVAPRRAPLLGHG